MQCSIIIPVYNVEKYLDQCLESVVNQSNPDFECILVNDGSTDNSGNICDKWANADNRFRVIHQENQGVSSARNKGLENAKGEFIVFIDSDDWVEEDYLYSLMGDDNSDYIVAGLVIEQNTVELYQYTPQENKIVEFNKNNIKNITQIFEDHLFFGPVFKRYKSSIIKENQIKFNTNVSYGEDLLFNFEYLKHVTKIRTISKAAYHYRRFEATTLSTKFDPNYWEINYSQWLILKEFFQEKGIFIYPLIDIMYQRLWGIIYDSVFLLNKLNLGFIQSYRYVKKIFSIPEVRLQEFAKCQFYCSKWIKFLIINQLTLVFILIYKLKK